MDSKTLVALALLDALGAEQGLLTYFADLCGPAWLYTPPLCNSKYVSPSFVQFRIMSPSPLCNSSGLCSGAIFECVMCSFHVVDCADCRHVTRSARRGRFAPAGLALRALLGL